MICFIDGIPAEICQILKDDAVKVLHSICQEIRKNSAVATGLENVSIHSNPKKWSAKECSNYHTIALIWHTSKVMLIILHAKLQQYINRELSYMFKLDLEKTEEPEIKLPTSGNHQKSKRGPRKSSTSGLLTTHGLWLCGSQQTVDNS